VCSILEVQEYDWVIWRILDEMGRMMGVTLALFPHSLDILFW
jgi:hypothetical protein